MEKIKEKTLLSREEHLPTHPMVGVTLKEAKNKYNELRNLHPIYDDFIYEKKQNRSTFGMTTTWYELYGIIYEY